MGVWNLSGSSIDWGVIGQTDFNHLVEVLILRRYDGDASVDVRAVDGRGGDGGIDIDVRDRATGQVVRIYQLKWFREGFSGGFRDTRRAQITESFRRAIEHAPTAWALVVPCEGTLSERKFLTSLAKGHQVRIEFVGRTQLNAFLIEDPRVHDWATRDSAIEALKQVRREQAVLSRPTDLGNEVWQLAQRLDARSAYWGYDFSKAGTTVTQTLFAKRPDAAAREPLTIRMNPAFGPEHAGLREQFEDALGYGGSRPLVLPGDVVGSVLKEGPEWFAEEVEVASVELHPGNSMRDVGRARVVTRDGEGRQLAALGGTGAHLSAGTIGGSVDLNLEGGLFARWRFSKLDPDTGTTLMSFDPTGHAATAASRALRFIGSLEEASSIVLKVDELNAVGTIRPETSSFEVDLQVVEWIDDLAYLERELDRSFVVSETLPSALDRVWLRCARLVLEGKTTLVPTKNDFSFTLTGGLDESLVGLLEYGGTVQISEGNFTLNILGEVVEIGEVAVFHTHLRAVDGDAHLRALRAGKGEGRVVSLEPTDDTAYRMYMPSRMDGDVLLIPVPWGITGIGEHRSLSGLLDFYESTATDKSASGPAGG